MFVFKYINGEIESEEPDLTIFKNGVMVQHILDDIWSLEHGDTFCRRGTKSQIIRLNINIHNPVTISKDEVEEIRQMVYGRSIALRISGANIRIYPQTIFNKTLKSSCIKSITKYNFGYITHDYVPVPDLATFIMGEMRGVNV